jgi:hypothetical protein
MGQVWLQAATLAQQHRGAGVCFCSNANSFAVVPQPPSDLVAEFRPGTPDFALVIAGPSEFLMAETWATEFGES